jgi:hypothetical protein
VLTFAIPAVLLSIALKNVGFQAGLITGVVLMALEMLWGFVNYIRGYRRVGARAAGAQGWGGADSLPSVVHRCVSGAQASSPA